MDIDISINLEDLKNIDFSRLDPNNMGSWPFPLRLGLIILSFAVVVGLGIWMDTTPQWDQLKLVEKKEQSLRQEFTSLQKKAALLDTYKKQLATVKATLQTMLKKLPTRTQVESLLEDINKVGLSSGLEFALFKPEGEVPKELYAELPIRLKVTGYYHNFGAFVSGIASLDRIVTLHDVRIEPTKGGGAQRSAQANSLEKLNIGILAMDALVKTYRSLDEETSDENSTEGQKSADQNAHGTPK